MSDYIKQISSGGLVYPLKDEEARNNIEELFEIANDTYEGRDLTVVFADEIKNFDDEWAWIKARINQGDFSGLRHKDYIPMTLIGGTKETHDMMLNINTYAHSTDVELGDCIDFISRDCYSETVQWNTTNINNGNANNANPYMVSNLYDFLNNTLYGYLPATVRNKITNKRMRVESRYSSGSTLTDSTSWDWADLGPIWPLTEYEVFGSVIWGTPQWSSGMAVQYPVFKGGWQDITKRNPDTGNRCYWWLISARSGSSTSVCDVSSYGTANVSTASAEYRVPICFRIAADA